MVALLTLRHATTPRPERKRKAKALLLLLLGTLLSATLPLAQATNYPTTIDFYVTSPNRQAVLSLRLEKAFATS